MRYAIYGVGGVGGFFGARLAAAGADVVFLARGAHLEAMRTQGLVLASPEEGDVHVEHPVVTDDPAEAGPVDVVFLTVKTWQLPEALRALPTLMRPGSAVVTTQNGVEAPGHVADVVGRDAVLPGVVRVFAQLDGPGRVLHLGGPGSLTFGSWTGEDHPRLEPIRADLAAAATRADVVPDPFVEIWTKFAFFAPYGTLGAALDAPIGVLRDPAGPRDLFARAIGEVADLADASGVPVRDDLVAATLAFADAMPDAATTSLQRDVLAGRRSELDACPGAVHRLGAARGLPTPIHSVLYEVLRHVEARRAALAGTTPAS